ncbi:DUF1697 domain-containing protein [Dermacoccaceae bacterium W4C1]
MTIRSAELRDCIQSLPQASGVCTVLATGNVVLRSDLTAEQIRAEVESALREQFAYPAWVVVLDVATVQRLVSDLTHPVDDADTHVYVTLASDPKALDAWGEVAAEVDQETQRLHPAALAWTCPVGRSLDTPFAKAQTRAPLKAWSSAVTTRSARTLLKVLEKAATA